MDQKPRRMAGLHEWIVGEKSGDESEEVPVYTKPSMAADYEPLMGKVEEGTLDSEAERNRPKTFTESIHRSMMEVCKDMEFHLIHIESSVCESMEEWNAKPWWFRAYYRYRWWMNRMDWAWREKVAHWLYPNCTCDHEDD